MCVEERIKLIVHRDVVIFNVCLPFKWLELNHSPFRTLTLKLLLDSLVEFLSLLLILVSSEDCFAFVMVLYELTGLVTFLLSEQISLLMCSCPKQKSSAYFLIINPDLCVHV